MSEAPYIEGYRVKLLLKWSDKDEEVEVTDVTMPYSITKQLDHIIDMIEEEEQYNARGGDDE